MLSRHDSKRNFFSIIFFIEYKSLKLNQSYKGFISENSKFFFSFIRRREKQSFQFEILFIIHFLFLFDSIRERINSISIQMSFLFLRYDLCLRYGLKRSFNIKDRFLCHWQSLSKRQTKQTKVSFRKQFSFSPYFISVDIEKY